MSDIHTCSYHCDRPECVKAQRDELREALVNAAPDIEMRAHITALESALRDCVTHMKTAGSPEAVRAAEAAERLLGDA